MTPALVTPCTPCGRVYPANLARCPRCRPDSESQVQAEIRAAWGAHPRLRFWRQNTGVGWFADGKPARESDPGAYPVHFGTAGQADISGLFLPHGRRLELEVKAARGKQSKEQIAFQRMIRAMGGVCEVVRSLSDADQILIPLVGRR